jgi:U3 small nucleolar RNA-associated protein 10
MAASALATQLRALAVRSAAPAGTRVASFLFDQREAADLDVETVHGLGVNGLAELAALDPRVAVYEPTLFHPRLRTLDRALETREVNAQLDAELEGLLVLLSPHFLLKPAHKVLEWLVRKLRYVRTRPAVARPCL